MPTPLNQTMSQISLQMRTDLAGTRIGDIANNTYLAIGRNQPWDINDNLIPTPTDSTDTHVFARQSFCAIKQISIADGVLVTRRVDWIANTIYTPYSNNENMYAYSDIDNANGQVTTLIGNNQVIGSNTTFLLDYANNDLVTLPGDGIYILPQTLEVINVSSNTLMICNNSWNFVYTANTPEKTINTYPNFVSKFYVRNIYDQVFLCLYNNFGAPSTVMPTISLGGNLPTNPYIITSDGYKWKYLYTISGGYKQAFFTSQWMPVIEDQTVESAAVEGRIDIVVIKNGGIGYNGNVASFSAPILNVMGNGNGANITAQVSNTGTITGINILNGGSGYTLANVTANVGATGNGASFLVVPGPDAGYGSNAALELGATSVMFSIDLNDTENGTIPTIDYLSNFFRYRQIVLWENPTLANGSPATSLNYDMSYVVQCSTTTPFNMNDTVFQGPDNNINNAIFTGTVVWFDDTSNQLHLNNINGIFNPILTLYDANNSHVSCSVYSITNPQIEPFSGTLTFIENRAAITRSPGQQEAIKIILEF